MSTYIIHQSNIAVSSVWQDGAAPSLETRYREFNLADMPQGAVITNALLSCEPWGDGQQQTMNGSAAPRQELPADSVSPGGVLRIPFVFQGKNTAGQPSGACAGGWNHITLTLTYQVMTTAVAAPTSVSLSSAVAQPGESLTLFWSGAIRGDGVAIGGYEIHRAAAAAGPYSLLCAVDADAGSCPVAAPAAPGSFYFKVKTLAENAPAQNSDLSSAYAGVTVSVTAPAAPAALTLSDATVLPEAEVTLSFSGAAPGLANPISGYAVYAAAEESGPYEKRCQLASTETAGQAVMQAPASGALYLKVATLGSTLNSPLSAAAVLTVDASTTSDFALARDAVDAGTPFQATILSHTDAAHTLTVRIGAFHQALSLAAGSASFSFTPPLAWLEAMPDAAQAPLQVTLATKGAGAVTHSLLLCCPESQAPVVSGAACAPAAGEVPESWQVYVAGKSKAFVSLNTPAQAFYGASIVGYEIAGCGANAMAAALPLSAETDYLPAGERQVIVSAVDSRGLRGSQTVTIPVLPYSPPEISGASAERRDAQGQEADEGTFIRAAAAAGYADCGGHNSVACAVAYRARGDADWVYAGNLTDGALLFGGGQMDIAKDYEIRLLATDAFGAQACHYLRVPRAQFTLHFQQGGKAAAFFGPANRESTLRVSGNLLVDGATYSSDLFSYDAAANTLTIRPFVNTFSFDAETGVLSITDNP